MEEQREESEFVGDCREPMKEAGLSSKVQTLVGEDDNTVKVSDLGVSDVSEADVSLKAGDGKVGNSVSDEKQMKSDVGSVEDVVETKDNVEESNVVSSVIGEVETKVNVEKTVSSADVERTDAITELETERNGMDGDARTVVVKPVDETESSELCNDVQRVSEMNDETAINGKIRSLNSMMKRGENLEFFPTDLITEIFSRLPAKSAASFRILSKQWDYILSSPDS